MYVRDPLFFFSILFFDLSFPFVPFVENVPVFNEFDNYQLYDDHKVENYTKYLIHASCCIESAILFDAEYSIIYGYVLNKIDSSLFKILYYRRPSNLIESNSAGNIKNLWNTQISDTQRRDSDNKKIYCKCYNWKIRKKEPKNSIIKNLFRSKRSKLL